MPPARVTYIRARVAHMFSGLENRFLSAIFFGRVRMDYAALVRSSRQGDMVRKPSVGSMNRREQVFRPDIGHYRPGIWEWRLPGSALPETYGRRRATPSSFQLRVVGPRSGKTRVAARWYYCLCVKTELFGRIIFGASSGVVRRHRTDVARL